MHFKEILGTYELAFKQLIECDRPTADREQFSALRRLKTYLIATMKQERLNYVTVLHVHQDGLDSIDLQKVKGDFVSANRLSFGV